MQLTHGLGLRWNTAFASWCDTLRPSFPLYGYGLLLVMWLTARLVDELFSFVSSAVQEYSHRTWVAFLPSNVAAFFLSFFKFSGLRRGMNSGAHGFRTSLRALTFTKLCSTRRLTTLPGAGLRRNNRNWMVLLKASLGLQFNSIQFNFIVKLA